MKIPITQSEAWQKLQDELDEESVLITKKTYRFLAVIKKTPVGNYLYCPYGPVAKDEKAFKEALIDLQEVARRSNAVFIRIEPQSIDLAKCLPKKSKKTQDLNPKETWVLDLTGSDEQFTERLPSRLLRYYRTAAKKGISIRKTHNPKEISHLVKLQDSLAKQKGINIFSEKYLATELAQPFATLYLIEYQEPEANNSSDHQVALTDKTPEIIAAGLVFDHEDTRYNLQGAQSDLGRKLHATGILTIELIKDARKKGLKFFDFWGIAPEGAPQDHPWAGFTEFKKTFHGEPKYYLGTYDLPLNSAKYATYQVLRKLNRLRRRI